MQNIVTKDFFVDVPVDEISLKILSSHSQIPLISHTQYLIEVNIRNMYVFHKNTRYRHLEAFDIVLKNKFKNLSFPKLPGKGQIFKFNYKDERQKYLQQLLDKILFFSKRHPNLKVPLFRKLYNFLNLEHDIFGGEAIMIPQHEVKEITEQSEESGSDEEIGQKRPFSLKILDQYVDGANKPDEAR